MGWNEILNDSRFKELNWGDRLKIANTYFDKKIGSDIRYLTLPSYDRDKIRERFIRSIGPNPDPSDFESFVNGFLSMPSGMMADFYSLFGDFEESSKIQEDIAFDRPSKGLAGLAGSAAASALPSIAAGAMMAIAPPVGAALGLGVLASYALSSAGSARRLVYDYEKTTGREVDPANEIALSVGMGAVTALTEQFGMVFTKRLLKSPIILESLGKSLIYKNIPEAARIISSEAVEEGLEEVTEQVAQNALVKLLVNPEQSIKEGVGEAFIGGAIGGGVASSILGLKSVRRMARKKEILIKGEAPKIFRGVEGGIGSKGEEEVKLLPPPEVVIMPEDIEEANRKLKRDEVERNYKELDAELRIVSLMPDKVKDINEARQWQRLFRLVVGDDPKEIPIVYPIEDINRRALLSGKGIIKPSLEVKPIEGISGAFTNEALEIAERALTLAAQEVSDNPKKRGVKMLFEASRSEFLRAWAMANPDDVGGLKLREYLEKKKLGFVDDVAKISEKVPRKFRDTKRKGKGITQVEEGRKRRRLKRRRKRRVTKWNMVKKRSSVWYQERVRDAILEESGPYAYEEMVNEVESNPTMVQRYRLAAPLVMAGVVDRVVQTPDQLYEPGTNNEVNGVIDTDTGTIYLSKDIDITTIGHEAFHRLVDVLGTDNEIVKNIVSYAGDIERAGDLVGKYYADRALDNNVVRRVGNWLKDMWIAIKSDVGLEVRGREELLRAINVHFKGLTNPKAIGKSRIRAQIKAYHGTNREFKKFSLRYAETGLGDQFEGAGVYLTDTEDFARIYATLSVDDPIHFVDKYGINVTPEVMSLFSSSVNVLSKIDLMGGEDVVIDSVLSALQESRNINEALIEEFDEGKISDDFKSIRRLSEENIKEIDRITKEIKNGDIRIAKINPRYVYEVTAFKDRSPGDYKILAYNGIQVGDDKELVIKGIVRVYGIVRNYMENSGIGKVSLQQAAEMFSYMIDIANEESYTYSDIYHYVVNTVMSVVPMDERQAASIVSLSMKSVGIDGVRTNNEFGAENKYNYVIYVPSSIIIDSVYKFQSRRRVRELAGNVNIGRVQIDEALKELAKKEYGQSVDMEVYSNEELLNNAREVIRKRGRAGMVKLAERFRKTGRISLEEEVALRIYANTQFFEALNIWDRFKDSGEGVDEVLKMIWRMGDRDFELASLLSKDRGRRLQAGNIVTDPRVVFDLIGKLERGLTKEKIEELKEIVENGLFLDPVVMSNFMNTLEEPRLVDQLHQLYVSFILSRPTTMIKNAASNARWLRYLIGHRAIESAVDATLSSSLMQAIFPSLRGRSRRVFFDEVVSMWQGVKYRRGSIADKLIQEGVLDPDVFNESVQTKWRKELGRSFKALERSSNPYVRKLAPYFTWSLRAMHMTDLYFRALAFDAELNALAVRMSKLKGKSPSYWLANPTKEMEKQAAKFAEYAVFMSDPSSLAKKLLDWREKKLFGVGKFLVPFLTTPDNLLQRGLEMVPGVGALLFKGKVDKGVKRSTDLIAAQLEGAFLSILLLMAFDDDDDGEWRITGAAPNNPAEKDAFYRSGKIPYAIRFGDTWVSYREAEPFSFPIAIVGNLVRTANKMSDEEIDKSFDYLVHSVVETIISTSYLENVAVLFKERGMARFLERIPQGFVPFSGLVRSFYRVIEYQEDLGGTPLRDTKDFWAGMAQVIPSIPEEYRGRVKLNAFGEAVVLPGNMLRQWLPYKWSDVSNDPVELELERLGVYPGFPSKEVTIDGVKVELPDDFYWQYQMIYGIATKRAIIKAMNTNRYKRYDINTDEGKLKKIRLMRNYMAKERGKVRSRMIKALRRAYPELLSSSSTH